MVREGSLPPRPETPPNMGYLQRLRDWHKSSPISKDGTNIKSPSKSKNYRSYCSDNNSNSSDGSIKNVMRKKQKISSPSSPKKTPDATIVVENDDCSVHTEIMYPSPSPTPPNVKQEQVAQAALMKKWFIPKPAKPTPPEVTLLERIVWVKLHKLYWWPAIVYQNYAEIQQQLALYSQIDILTRFNIAYIMIQQGEQSKQRICRLLGRPNVELIAVEEESQVSEFYLQLPNVLPKACNSDYFSRHPHLYYDFHRALDQVETILYDFMGQTFTLKNGTNCGDDLTWLTRARIAEQAKWAEANPYFADWFECCTGLQVATEPPIITSQRMASNDLFTKVAVTTSGRDHQDDEDCVHDVDNNNNNNNIDIIVPKSHNTTSTKGRACTPPPPSITTTKKTPPRTPSSEVVGRTSITLGGKPENIWILQE